MLLVVPPLFAVVHHNLELVGMSLLSLDPRNASTLRLEL
jgi:hypothetical protein